MKITPKGSGDAELAVQSEKKIGPTRQEKEPAGKASGGASSVQISAQARRLQQIAELAKKGDELRAEKLEALKEKIDAGTYQVDPAEVAKSIVRSEVARALEKKPGER
jgi:negative regulator of flagellin synthesis FlgM